MKKHGSFGKALRSEWTKQNVLRLAQYALLALFTVLVTEMLARHSVLDAFRYLLERPAAFFYDVYLVFFTFSFALLFCRRNFVLSVVFGTWIGISVANSILLTYRSMPMTARDIWILGSTRDIIGKYLSLPAMILLMLVISALCGLIVFLWLMVRKQRGSRWFGLLHFLLAGLVLTCMTLGFVRLGLLDSTTEFSNLPTAYDRNGFAYCFSASLVTGGVSEPEDYSPDNVEEILEDTKIELPETVQDPPNLVFVQLESFFDVNYMKNLGYATNPVPNFQKLKKGWPHGLLSVPCIGAGTANTEFEVLTGMNLSHFGVGEYPYTTVTELDSMESLASVLGGLGYATHAIHNNNATFYNRDIVYEKFSFQTFTSLEYMDCREFNALKWAKDSILTEEILKCLRSDEKKDLVFTVSVQPHGKYPTELTEEMKSIAVTGMEDEGREAGFSYYLNELYESDYFVGELVRALEAFEEDTLVVFYGDHLPSFDIQQEELSLGNSQTTEYVIWANYPLDFAERNLQTYQLGAYALQRAGIFEGALFRLHQSYEYAWRDDTGYQEELQILEYDMLNGEGYFAQAGLPEPHPLRFDVEDIVIRDIIPQGEDYRILGSHFTPYSVVYVNDVPCDTQFCSGRELLISDKSLSDGDVLCVMQISAVDEMDVLSQSNSVEYKE